MGKDVPKFDTFEQFWPYYLQEHRDPTNRALHYIGTSGVITLFVIMVVTRNPWMFLSLPVFGYGFAWIGHFIIEKNRPATFTYPRWSLMGDFKMYGLWVTGRLGPHLQRAVGGGS